MPARYAQTRSISAHHHHRVCDTANANRSRDSAIENNVGVLARWCEERGISLAPHGKTTMMPGLFRRQLDAGVLYRDLSRHQGYLPASALAGPPPADPPGWAGPS